jgi:hypothetical protein
VKSPSLKAWCEAQKVIDEVNFELLEAVTRFLRAHGKKEEEAYKNTITKIGLYGESGLEITTQTYNYRDSQYEDEQIILELDDVDRVMSGDLSPILEIEEAREKARKAQEDRTALIRENRAKEELEKQRKEYLKLKEIFDK